MTSEPGLSPSPTARGLRPQELIPVLTTGVVVAVLEVVFAASMAALIFRGPLSDYVAEGIGLTLFGCTVAGAAVALLGSLSGSVGGIQDAPAAIFAIMAGAVVVAMPAGASGEATFATVAASIAVATLLTGASLLALGYFRLGNLVRFLPYPVIGGFLAGTGWIMFSGGLSLMSDLSLSLNDLPLFFEPTILLAWLPGLLWAILAFVAMRRFSHPLLLPGLIVLGIAIFYGIAWITGASMADLADQGFLLGPVPAGRMWPPMSIADLGLISWPVVFSQALSIATIILLSMVGVLLNASGLEVMFEKDMDLNKELRAAGAGNLFAGMGAGTVGFQQLSGSAMAKGLKGASRRASLLAAGVCVLFLFFGGAALSFFPKAILGGLVLLVGVSFLYDWLVETWPRLPRQDYAIVVVIVITTALVGFLQAVIVGLLIAVILFAVSYSSTNVIRVEMNSATYHSRVSRTRQERALLNQVADRLAIFQLQGFIFFGTADSISSRVERRIAGDTGEKPRYVILDFSQVTGLDSTASISFSKLIEDASGREVTLGISAPKPVIWRQLLQAGLCKPGDGFRIFSTLDKGVEWCEEQLLAALGSAEPEEARPMVKQLAEILNDAEGAAALMPYLERLEVAAGQRLITQGAPADAMYFIESGRVTAQLVRDGQTVRLQSMGSGHVIGEIGFYLGRSRTADVVADEASVMYQLTLADLERMRAQDPRAATTLHRLVAILMAERVAYLTAIVQNDRGDGA